MTSRLVTLKRAIGGFVGGLEDIRDVQPFGKLIEAEDIARVLFKSPCAFVSVLAAPGGEALPEGDSRTRVDVAVGVAAKGSPGTPEDEETLGAAEAIYRAVRWRTFGLDHIWPAQDRRMEIVPVPGRTGVAILAVRWSHFMIIDDADVIDDEAEFETSERPEGTLREPT